jgi:cytochrome b561
MLGMLLLGLYMGSIDPSPFKFSLYTWHKSFGTLVLMLALLRLSWRFINIAPAHLPNHQQWEVTLAKIAHVLLYILMIAMPLSGWIMSSAGEFHYAFFGLFEMPMIVPKNENLMNIAREAHEIQAYVLMGIIGLHAAGAFKHHFIDKDETLKRMTSDRAGFKVEIGRASCRERVS